ncbi:cell wall-binding repeat-containing protein [Leifsonia sp. NPDC058248]|uniref:cell wall-binding repeat-containing protein n=1 Tax=Leifsonia sp. NPDC058248 TaxID=3346402 RepID=UPI0036DA323E
MKASTIGAGVVSVTLLVGLLGVAPAMASTTPRPDPSPAPAAPQVPDAHMGDYSASRFDEQAAGLPADLTDAVERDLGVSPEQYLASAAATYDAGQVIDGLTNDGVTIESARLEGGTRLVLGVASAKDVTRAAERGAVAVVGLKASEDLSKVKFTKAEALVNGTGWGYDYVNPGDSTKWIAECSVGFNGHRLSTGKPQFVTAGHCAEHLPSPPASSFKLTQSKAGPTARAGSAIGMPDPANFHYGDGLDSGLVDVANPSLTPLPQVTTWGGGTGASTAGTQVSVLGTAQALVGSIVCKSGMTSGWTCGKVLETATHILVSDTDVNALITSACAIPGDSGGPALLGKFALGVLSGSGTDDKGRCLSAFFPIVDPNYSVQTQHPDWEIAVDLQKPVVSNPSGVAFQSVGLAGSLLNGVPGDTAYLYLDGATTPTSQVAIVSAAAWKLPLAGVSLGAHTYRVVVRWGQRNTSAAATGSVIVAAAPAVDRIQAADRYKTAVAISRAGFPSTTGGVVYIVSGQAFPDALSAAPVAASQNGPLLLTMNAALPSIVKAEIARLAPRKIVIIGGPAAISPGVETALRATAPHAAVARVAGSNRYATARALVGSAFGATGVNTLYIATGKNFPDALSAGAAAGSSGSAVLLVPGTSTSLDATTLALIAKLHPKAIRIAGGLAAVSAGIEKALAGKAPSVKRLAGSGRWTTSQLINADAFPSASRIYLASGLVFPDALAGAVLAAKNASPLYVSQTNCVPPGVLRAIAGYGVSRVTVLGGTSAQSPNVAKLVSCAQ